MIWRFLMACAVATSILCAQPRLPRYTRETFPNGATLILLQKPDVPLVTVRAVFRGGADAEPDGWNGVASITSELMRRGTVSRTSEQIALQLDSIGANLNLGSNRQMSFVSTEFLGRTAEAALGVFEDVLMHPTFPEEEVKKAVAQAIDQVLSVKDNPRFSLARYFNGFFYPPGHPYRNSGAADEASLGRMTRERIADFHRRMYVGRNLILIVAGDFDASTLGARMGKIAAALPAGTAFAAPKSSAPRFESSRLLLIDQPQATQTYFAIGMPGIDRTSPERAPLLLVNTIFGGRFTSMLNDELRVNSGLTYGANSQLELDRLTGAILINSYTRTETTEKAIDLALTILGRLREKGIDAAQLASAKAYIKGNFPTDRLETADQLADILGELELFGLNKGEIDDLFSRLDAVTLEKANAAARQYYRTENLQFCLIGNAAKMHDAVKKYAAKMKVISVKDPGFSAPAF